jgi:hypothetical protein
VVLKVQRAATLETRETSKADLGQSTNEAVVADIEAVTSPLLIMDKVPPPSSLCS